ncbi:unnamed protein product [Rotaria socialis]|uniref:Proactivator polypeptide n=1 Tax=Rotaria socialis TaxID=392032 RepID=A0A818M552_9BILA|nr:unnamed protein product [Rotaria socialis]
MAKAAFVTSFLVLFITVSYGYKQECAIGPQYWCQSFETAQDCGSLRHCTDTVWRYDAKSTKVDSSTTCEWCQKILENTHQGIQHLANNEDLIRSSLVDGCKLFPLATVSSKCTNALENYGTSVTSLMKHKRYATLCRLMNICSNESVTEASSTEKPVRLGQKRCTWGPSYWCSSLSNSRECSTVDHCSNNIWSKQSIQKKPNDNICQYCEFTIQKLRVIINDQKTEIDAEKWLAGACSMLPAKDAIDECVQMMSKYAEEILAVIKTNIDPGVICHLVHMCKEATVITRVELEDKRTEEKSIINVDHDKLSERLPIDQQSKMLCNVIVRATHELHVKQHKTRDEIQAFLKDDCQKLSTNELVQKCENIVEHHGLNIHAHVASKIELSTVCDYIDDFADHSALQSLPNVHCELCTFVLTTTKYMLDAKHTEDKVLMYIDEQVCARLTGVAKKNCKDIIENDGKNLINSIQSGTKSMLLCTRFQVCISNVLDKASPIEKNEKDSFLKENICEKLGSFKDACNGLIEKDANRLITALAVDMEGDDLCRIFGLCPKKMSLFDNLAVNDDKNKCQRCITDFTRRKHIAEKLVNHSSEFLHHLCEQLPQKDDCIKTVEESINELVDFVRSLDPQDICVKLNYCNETMLATMEQVQISSTDDVMSLGSSLTRDTLNCTLCKLAFGTIKKALTTNSTEQEIIQSIKVEICSKLGALAELCKQAIDTEGPAILNMIANDIDPKKACVTMGICAQSAQFANCNDKCDCCMSKIEIHEVRIATFLRAIVDNIKTLCKRTPGANKCLEMTTKLESNVNRITSRFNAKGVCQILNHCSTLPVEIETLSVCKSRIESKRQFLLSSISTINENLKSLCEYIPWNKDCYSIIDRSTFDVNQKVSQLDAEKTCTSGQSLVDLICIKNSPFEILCKQLVESNENSLRMEALFKSMFNRNGHLEKELCEFDHEHQSSDCKPSFTSKNCENKCDCCVQFYTTKKNYDLQMIETLRNGLLATCDWSLSKDYCISWFNRVCDRMKANSNGFTPTTFCKGTEFCLIEQESKIDGDKCETCKKRLNSRQSRFRTTVNEVTTALLSLCTDSDCRSLVQSAQQQSLNQIDKINSQTYCQRYGYCSSDRSSQTSLYLSRLLIHSNHHVGSSIEALDQRFESALSSDICFQYGQLRPMCDHLLASPQGHRYANVYMAILKNNPKLIDDDLREQMATKATTNFCDSCKNAIESSKDFLNNALDSVLSTLLRTCERCPVKDQCQDFYNQRFNDIKSYITNINSDQFCQSLHLCAKLPIIIKSDQCSKCVESLQTRKTNILHAMNRVVAYFDDLCQRFAGKQCQVFVKQIQDSFEESIDNFDPKQACNVFGFCSTTNNQNQMDFEKYEKYLEDEFDKNICSTLGPFETLCKQTIRGNRKQIETVKINYNVKDLMLIGEKLTNGMTTNFFNAANLNECNRDKCQCCTNQVNQKKDCAKNMGDKLIASFIASCDYCPAKDKCQKYWQDSQTQFDSCIDNMDSKQVCTRLGYCNVSSLCMNMGVFQQACEEALTAFTQSLHRDPEILEKHLPHTSVVVLPTKATEETDLLKDSNSTCILCEYTMKILSNYIHQNSTEQEIEQSLEKICNQMPVTLQKQCHELIDNYGPPIIAVLINDFDLSTICRKLNLCTNQMKVQVSYLTKANQATCGICDYVSTYINFALKRDSSEKSLQHALSTVCQHLLNEQYSQCQTLIQLVAPHIRTLELGINRNFCQQLTICQTSTDNMNVVKPSVVHVPLKKEESTKDDDELKQMIVKNLDITPQCTLCHYVISYLDAVLKNNKSEAAVEAALEKVCTILPSKERARCDDFVKTYGPVLAELIVEMADPDAICRYLGMCQVALPIEATTKKTAPVTYSNHDYVRLSAEPKPFACTICQFIITRMKHFATLNQTEEEILASLKQSCDLFTVINLKQQCQDFLQQYGPYIIQMISSDVEPKIACQNLGICEKNVATSPKPTVHQSTPPAPVASSTTYGKCIFGMNYWCTSRQNAELCNAVELCERQVWSKRNKNIVI